jgi:thiamine-monophosphate kinase
VKQSPLGAGGEFDLIRRILAGAGTGPTEPWLQSQIRAGPGDDCAVIRDGIAVSVDMSVEDVHFRRDWLEPSEIGYRSAAAALSDLAAMAARPIGILAALAVPRREADLAAGIMEGVAAAAHDSGAALLGGDLSRSPDRVVLDVVALGHAPNPVMRSGARPGHSIWVTGSLGGAAAAVAAWEQGRSPSAAARQAFARPTPRVAEAAWLRERGVLHALIDLSDGLAGDASHLAAASDVGILLDTALVPVHPAAAEGHPAAALRLALHGGEDYELCLAAPAGAIEALAEQFRQTFQLPLTRVGSVIRGSGVALRAPGGSVAPAGAGGFDHFDGSEP